MPSGWSNPPKGGWSIKDFNRVALAITRFSYWSSRGSMGSIGSRAMLQEVIKVRESRIDIKRRAIGHAMQ